MKYQLEAIEKCKGRNEMERHRSAVDTRAGLPLQQKDAGNELPNFAEVIWDEDIETILADCRRLGVKEFTIAHLFKPHRNHLQSSKISAARWTES